MIVKCPKCGETIDLSESDSAEIIKQVRTAEFDAEVKDYKQRMEKEKESEIKAIKVQAESDAQKVLSEKDKELNELRLKLTEGEAKKQLEITEAKNSVKEEMLKKQSEIESLSLKLNSAETEKQLAVTKAVQDTEKQYREQLNEKEAELQKQKEEVAYYRDMKARKSTKAIGESLELHCQDEYDIHLRPVLPDAYFEKDNEISETGSKGDYIFREEKDGIPLLSIMFEMKNDSEETETRHKNEYFFKELDKDRKEKGCEYAVLVSMLESDSEYYNQGIVDVSHRYPKMFVIRPQFLIPLITLLRNSALAAHESKLELEQIKGQNIDVTNFEDKLNSFKDKFSRSCELTGKKFEDAISQIDKAIKDLEKVKEALTASGKHLVAADNQLEDLTIKKLTYNNPTMKAKFEEIKK